mmetsp:Transcript_835/g.1219  ORF Transcript_835/g.1219 Transcript_835/m.1219 type:complete len:225 (-) Transcript_835:89-763(-)
MKLMQARQPHYFVIWRIRIHTNSTFRLFCLRSHIPHRQKRNNIPCHLRIFNIFLLLLQHHCVIRILLICNTSDIGSIMWHHHAIVDAERSANNVMRSSVLVPNVQMSLSVIAHRIQVVVAIVIVVIVVVVCRLRLLHHAMYTIVCHHLHLLYLSVIGWRCCATKMSHILLHLMHVLLHLLLHLLLHGSHVLLHLLIHCVHLLRKYLHLLLHWIDLRRSWRCLRT